MNAQCMPDDALFHAPEGDCSLPPYFYFGFLVETAVLVLVFFATLVYKARQTWRNVRESRSLIVSLVVHEFLVLAFAASAFAQSGFFEANVAVSACLIVSVFVAIRAMVRFSLSPAIFTFSVGKERLAHILTVFDVYGFSVIVLNWIVLACAAAYARTEAFNRLIAVFVLVCTLGSGVTQVLYLFAAIYYLERSLRNALPGVRYNSQESAKAVEAVLVKLRQLRMNFLLFTLTNAIVPTAVALYILVIGTFPIGVPLSAIVCFSPLCGLVSVLLPRANPPPGLV